MTCERYQLWMTDAATEGLPTRRRAEFQMHIDVCSVCREEFVRLQALLKTIDGSIMNQCFYQPSPDLIPQVRRRIAAEPARAHSNRTWFAPAVSWAMVVIIVTAVWLVWPRGFKPARNAKTESASVIPIVANHSSPNPARSVKTVSKETATIRPVRSAATRKIEQRKSEEGAPEVIIPPGEADAVLQLAALLRSGKLDGTKLLSEQREADQPIEIKPILIPLLENTSQAQDKSTASDGQGPRRDFVSGESAQGFLP